MSYPVPQSYPTQVVTPLARRCSTGHIVTAWILTVLTGLYLLPWAIAATRSKQKMAPVVLVNVFLGWTAAGWIVALVLACLPDPPAAVVVTHQPVEYGTQPVPPQLGYSNPHGHHYGQPYGQMPNAHSPAQSPRPSGSWPVSQPTASYGDEPTQVIRDPRDHQGF